VAGNELRLSAVAVHEIVHRLTARPDAVLTLRAGLSSLGDLCQWLVHDTTALANTTMPHLRVAARSHREQLGARLREILAGPPEQTVVGLALGLGNIAGHVTGAIRTPVGTGTLDRLVLVGPGFLPITLRREARVPARASAPAGGVLNEILSRTIGALGADIFGQLRQLRVAVIGCGRSGSLAADALAALGVAQLALIDPDRMEMHNLGEMPGARQADVGRPKVEVLAEAACRSAAGRETAIQAVQAPVQALPALYALKPVDVLVSCPDAPAPRLAAAVLAALYLKPLLDIGTGIVSGPEGRRMGADVRLVLPGRCLLCLGGVADLPSARAALVRGESPGRAGDFRTERLGSLRSLNTLAVSLGQTLLEQWLTGRVSGSVWLQLDIDAAGLPRLTQPAPLVRPECPLCSATAWGDAGLEALPAVLARL
jgi:molybdopterin/thiamine biosynthesis adenylyltransferase